MQPQADQPRQTTAAGLWTSATDRNLVLLGKGRKCCPAPGDPDLCITLSETRISWRAHLVCDVDGVAGGAAWLHVHAVPLASLVDQVCPELD